MRAVAQERYGAPADVLELRDDVADPVAGEGEVLLRVRAASVAGDDWHLMRGLPWVARMETGLRRPKRSIPGQDVAGTVESVGPGVTTFAPGDDVFGWARSGAFAELAVASADSLVALPAGLTHAEAAAVPLCGVTALQGLRDRGEVDAGRRVLVNGAAGGVGSFAVQIGRALGAEVTGVCSTGNVDFVRSLGAAGVIDYTEEDFTASGRRWEVILDLVGNRSLSACRRALTPGGTLVLVGGRGGRFFMGTDRWLRALALSPFVAERLRPLIHTDSRDDLLLLTEWIEAGEITPVVGRRFRLDEVAEAIRSFEAWHARGKLVVTM